MSQISFTQGPGMIFHEIQTTATFLELFLYVCMYACMHLFIHSFIDSLIHTFIYSTKLSRGTYCVLGLYILIGYNIWITLWSFLLKRLCEIYPKKFLKTQVPMSFITFFHFISHTLSMCLSDNIEFAFQKHSCAWDFQNFIF